MLEASLLNPWIAWITCSLFAVALLVLTKGGKIPPKDTRVMHAACLACGFVGVPCFLVPMPPDFLYGVYVGLFSIVNLKAVHD